MTESQIEHVRGEIRYRETMKAASLAERDQKAREVNAMVAVLDAEIAELVAKLPAGTDATN